MKFSYQEARVIVRKFNLVAWGDKCAYGITAQTLDRRYFMNSKVKLEKWEIEGVKVLKNNKLNRKLYKNQYITFQNKLFIKDQNYDEFGGVTYL